MESNEKVELLQRAINQLIEEEKGSGYDDDVSRLLSQLDSWKEEEIPVQTKEELLVSNELNSSEIDDSEEIIKEIKEVKKQNTITHRLLSAMIVLTLAWQFSEVSLILKVKNRLSNPVKSIGNMFRGVLKSPIIDNINHEQVEKEAASFVQQCGVKAPELPYIFSGEE